MLLRRFGYRSAHTYGCISQQWSRPSSMAPTPVLLASEQTRHLSLAPEEAAFREGSTTIVLPSADAAFLNPVQQFNRDVSTLAIRTWSEERDDGLRRKFESRRAKGDGMTGKRKRNKRAKMDADPSAANGEDSRVKDGAAASEEAEASSSQSKSLPAWRPAQFTLLEALSATGLRSIRYAHEIPLLRTVFANDISPTAVEAIKRNVALNFPDDGQPLPVWKPEGTEKQATVGSEPGEPKELEGQGAAASMDVDDDVIMAAENAAAAAAVATSNAQATAAAAAAKPTAEPFTISTSKTTQAIHPDCKVRISQGDATSLMYEHRGPGQKFDVVDLDPYGSAVPFLDGAVQSVADDGLLCVTCTDLAVLAGHNYPEKAFSSYGGVSARSEYVHEVALRLVLHSVSSAAARYGRAVTPLLSLSIDFYLRVFVRINTSPKQVKALASNTGTVYVCSGCYDFAPQYFGRMTQRDNGDHKFSSALGPAVGEKCGSCGYKYHLAGPMYLGPLHDPSFCTSMLRTLNTDPRRFATAPRISGMVGLAARELDTHFYFTPAKISGLFHCPSPPLALTTSALLWAGYKVSRSHTQPGSLKTSATRRDIVDMMRTWVRIRSAVPQFSTKKISATSPSFLLATTPPRAVQEDVLKLESAPAVQGEENEGEGGASTAGPWWIDEVLYLEACNKDAKAQREQAMTDVDDAAASAEKTATNGSKQASTQPKPTLWHIHASLPLHPDTHSTLAEHSGAGEACGSAEGEGTAKARAASKVKGVRYQENPLPYWGPGTAARGGGVKRKEKRAREEGDA